MTSARLTGNARCWVERKAELVGFMCEAGFREAEFVPQMDEWDPVKVLAVI